MSLNDVEPNKIYKILQITGTYRNRLAELGFNPGCKIIVTNKHHKGLLVINCRESQITLRTKEADCIHVEDYDV